MQITVIPHRWQLYSSVVCFSVFIVIQEKYLKKKTTNGELFHTHEYPVKLMRLMCYSKLYRKGIRGRDCGIDNNKHT